MLLLTGAFIVAAVLGHVALLRLSFNALFRFSTRPPVTWVLAVIHAAAALAFPWLLFRYRGGFGPLLLGYLASMVFGGYGEVLSWRYAGVTMCIFFLLGLAVLPFAPETKGKPLPE